MELEVRIYKKLKEFDLDVEFAAADGCTGLMGPSGSGKSMLLRCICGIESPDRGWIALNGNVLYDSKNKINIKTQKRHVGYLFQSYALFPNMTVYRNVLEGARCAGLGEDRVRKVLDKFRVRELSDRYPRQLSGGQRQRVALARLMAGNPDAILLDEPFSALDEELKGELIEEMKEMLSDIEKPVILVSHSGDEVRALCSSLYKINKGRFIK